MSAPVSLINSIDPNPRAGDTRRATLSQGAVLRSLHNGEVPVNTRMQDPAYVPGSELLFYNARVHDNVVAVGRIPVVNAGTAAVGGNSTSSSNTRASSNHTAASATLLGISAQLASSQRRIL
ncbi:Fc.00g018240.m01.CDS01 [Cosmosporella sp. VM-42]